MTLRLALFDCDGTLADSEHAIIAAMQSAFAACDLPPPSARQVRAIIGLSLAHGIDRIAGNVDVVMQQRIGAAYREAYFKARAGGSLPEPLFDGMVDVLDQLACAGWQLGIATGKSQRGLLRLLDAHGLTGRFVTLQTADHHPSKPDPSMALAAMRQTLVAPRHCVVIGDTSFDMAMARAAGAHALGVSWGAHLPDQLKQSGAQRVVDRPDQLVDALNEATSGDGSHDRTK